MRLLKDFVFMAGARIGGIGIVAALNVVLTRALGPEGRGLYALPTIDCGLAATSMLGLASALSHFLLKKNADRGIVRATLIATGLFLLVGIASTVITGVLNRQLWAVGPALVFLPMSALLTLASGYCIGRNRIRYAGFISIGIQTGTLIFVILGFAFVRRTPAVAVAGWLIGTGLVAVVAACLTFRHARRGSGAPVDLRSFVAFGAKAGAVNVVTLLNYRIDVYVVAAIAPLSMLGIYVIAVAGAEAAVSLAHSFSLAMQPRVGSLDSAESAAFTAQCVRINVIFAALLCGLTGIVAEPAVRLLFGPGFAPVVPVLRVLLVGVVALSIGTVISNYFILNAGRAAVPLVTGAVSAALCAGISIVAVPRVGIIGAALGTATGYIVSQCVSIFWFCRTTGIHPARVLVINADDLALYKRVFMRKTTHALRL